MYYLTEEHEELFQKALGMYPSKREDKEYATAFYLLTLDEDIWNCAKQYIGDDGIRFTRLLDKTGGYSTTTQRLFRLAFALFNESAADDYIKEHDERFTILDVICGMGTWDEVVDEAFKIRRWGINHEAEKRRNKECLAFLNAMAV